MRKITIVLLMSGAAILSITTGFDIMDADGKAGKTGSPGETTCAVCHNDFVLNDGTGSLVISSPDLIGWEYKSGETYTIDITISRSGNTLFGFDCECLTATNQNGGTFQVTNSQTQIMYATVMSVVRENMVHTLNAGIGTNSYTYSFLWTAPTTNVGDITFYVTGNAADGNSQASGDHIYSSTQTVTFSTGTGIASDNLATGDFSIINNPVSDLITISFRGKSNEAVSFQLYAPDGKLISELFHGTSNGGKESTTIKTPANLSKGIYYLRFNYGTSTSSRKMIIN